MEKRKKKKVLFGIEIAAMTFLYGILDTAGIYKYIVSIAIIFTVFFLKKVYICELKEQWYLFIPVILYCGMGACFSVFGGNLTFWTFKTLAFWLIPPALALMLSKISGVNKIHMVDIQFYGAVISYLVTKIGYILIIGKWESPFAFVFGMFVIYYIWHHRWGHGLLALALMHFANKRIAALAVLLCLVLMIFLKLFRYSIKWIVTLWVLLMATVVVYLYGIFSGLFTVFCERFQIDTMTRIDIYTQIAQKVPKLQLRGNGLGAVNEMLAEMLGSEMFNRWYQNPHNDFLKIYIEVGAIGLILYLISFLFIFFQAWKSGVENRALSQLFVTSVYFMMLMTTDNVSIYILFLVPMYSICLALMSKKEKIYEDNAESS